MENILVETEKTLKTNEKYISADGKLLKAVVYADVMNMDKDLLSLLLQSDKIKKHFFENVNDILIFDKQKFTWFIESKEFLPDSYTRYTNKIGLTKDGKFISQSNDVVLDFPYKDCVLEGGQDRDDQKRQEIFYHETIASDQINRMLSPKVLTKAKRYTKDGVEENIKFEDNDNLIIKGNNLIVLSTLLERFEGKVKCIYIDPPYNTGSDSFNYNDSFNHSTWLTFMKNRLELAKKLLSEDGVISISCDDNEQAYLKVLCDDIFGRENFIGNIIRKTGSNRNMGNKGRTLDIRHENLLVFSRKQDANIFYGIKQEIVENEIYTQDFTVRSGGFEYEIPSLDFSTSFKRKWAVKEEKLKVMLGGNENSKYEDLYVNAIKIEEKNWYKINNFIFKSKKSIINEIKNKKSRSLVHSLWIDLISQKNVNKHFEKLRLNFSNPKLEEFIQRIIDISTKENDLVLDFHLGSGTTCAVAHKMGRQYIGVEQMDYIEDIAVERLKKVIDGEQGGISKAVNWQGGGSFVYCELMENSKKIITEIENSNDETINALKEKIYSAENIVPYIQKADLEKIDKEFNELTLDEKKKALCLLIDKNKLYVNYSDIKDDEYKVNDQDKEFTTSFYKEV